MVIFRQPYIPTLQFTTDKTVGQVTVIINKEGTNHLNSYISEAFTSSTEELFTLTVYSSIVECIRKAIDKGDSLDNLIGNLQIDGGLFRQLTEIELHGATVDAKWEAKYSYNKRFTPDQPVEG